MSPVESFNRSDIRYGGMTNVIPLTESIAALHEANSAGPDGTETPIATGEILTRMSIRVGEMNLLIPADGGREVIPSPPISRIPNTAPWLLGLTNVRGNLIPVIDAAVAFGMTRAASAMAYLLIFDQDENAMGFLIQGLPSLLTLSASERIIGALPLPVLLEGSVIATYRHADTTWLDVDLPVLFKTLARDLAR
jgi:twitching motility protein PilI